MTDPDEPVVEKWATRQVAEHLDIGTKTVSSYLARDQMPAPDGRTGPHNLPWWWSTTITEWQRPGQGVGGGPKPRPAELRLEDRSLWRLGSFRPAVFAALSLMATQEQGSRPEHPE